MTVAELIFKFIEKYSAQWNALPLTVRQLMVASPALFRLEESTGSVGYVPRLIFKETVRMKYVSNIWTVDQLFPEGTLQSQTLKDKPL